MFKHILVPLDGSSLAETPLPYAAYLATEMGASVTLIHVIEKNAPQEIHGEHHITTAEEALLYLQGISQRAFPPSVHVDHHVHTAEVSNVARSIGEHVGEFTTDLIVMCTHGSSGLFGWLVGSIAQQVIGMAKTPVILIHPTEVLPTTTPSFRLILVPVDENPDHALGTVVAGEVATACKASVHLLNVVPTLNTLKLEGAATGKLLPATMAAMLDMTEENAAIQLKELAKPLQERNINVTTQVSRGDPAAVIVSTGQSLKADLIVLGTHGKSGQDAFWSGSVAPKVSGQVNVPLLLVPVGKK